MAAVFCSSPLQRYLENLLGPTHNGGVSTIDFNSSSILNSLFSNVMFGAARILVGLQIWHFLGAKGTVETRATYKELITLALNRGR